MLISIVIGTSILLQFTTAYFSFRLIRVTGKSLAWTLISIALLFMAVRRCNSLYRFIATDLARQPDLQAELIALTISVLLLAGVTQITPIFTLIQRSEKWLRDIVEGTSTSLGTKFFRSLVQHLASTLQVRYSFIGQIEGELCNKIKTIAVWGGSDIVENMEYELKDTPCESVINNKSVCFPRNLQNIFPKDSHLAALKAQSYLGVPLFDSLGKPIGILAIMDDKALEHTKHAEMIMRIFASRVEAELERIKYDQLLKNERQNLFDMLDNLPLSFHLQAPDYSVPFANKMFQETFGSPKNRKCYDLMHKRTQPCEPCNTFRVFEGGGTRESVWHAVNGRIYLTVETPFKDVDGTLLVMEMAMDITEQKQAEEKLKEAHDLLEIKVEQRTATLASTNDELVRSNEALMGFATVASHDLQAPLNTIIAFGERLNEMEQNLSEQGEDFLSRMQKAGIRMQNLITGLLEFSRATTAPKKIETTDLNQTVLDVISDLENQITQTKASIEIGDLPTIEADQLQMRQLFQNLIGNALKFSKPDTPPCINIKSSLTKEGFWEILVEDNGIGFEMKYLESILKPFQRLHNHNDYEGSGIGLAISQKIVQRHDGTITARSSLEKGATFIITLPEKQTKV